MNELQEQLTKALSHAYDIERELPGGGMSRVFVAVERALGRRVVIKVLPPELAAGVNTERFRREIQLSAQLHHPHIVPVLAAGEIGEMLYYTMPYIEGESLNIIVDKSGAFAPVDVVRVLHDVVDALAYAHSRGVIHRDIKPANILSLGNHSLVTDFGVAKAISAALPTTGITSGGFAIGTPAYMAPEQLAADPQADHRIDIYAVGLLAYELLVGTSPFTGTSPQATMAAQLTRVPEPLHKVRDDVPPALSDIIARCLEKLPENRPASAQELLRELDSISTPQGAITAHRTPLARMLAEPKKYARQLTVAGVAVVLAVSAAFAGTTFLVGKQRELAWRQAAPLGGDSALAVATSGTDFNDRNPVNALTGAVTIDSSQSVQIADISALADSLRRQLSEARRRDSVFLSDSLRDVIEREVRDSIVRLQAQRSERSDPRSQFSGRGPIPRGSPQALRRPPVPGEKRVLIMDFVVRIGRPDSTRVGLTLADSLRGSLIRSGNYTAVSSRMARQIASSDDPRVMIDAIKAGAVLAGLVNGSGRRSDSVTVRLLFSEPARAIQPKTIATATTTLAGAGAVIAEMIPKALAELNTVNWPVPARDGRQGSRVGRGPATQQRPAGVGDSAGRGGVSGGSGGE